MSVFGITGVTVSVEIGAMDFGRGQKPFMSISSRLPEGAEPLQLGSDELIQDGLEKYFTAWETLMSGMLATGALSGDAFKQALASTLVRQEKVRRLYTAIKGKSGPELEVYLKQFEQKKDEDHG